MPVDDGAIITIGTIHGGEATNIICPSVTLTGTIRTSNSERRTLLVRRVGEIADGAASMHRGRARFSSLAGEPPVINDSDMVDRFRETVIKVAGEDKFVQRPASSGSDDFGYYSDLLPSIYFWIGTQEPGNDTGVHTPTFGASDKIVIPATELAVQYCLNLIRE